MSLSGSQQRAEIPPKRIHPNATSGQNGQEFTAKQQRNYQVFPGRNLFFCWGRLMTSRAYWAFLIALMILFVPSALFFAFTCPWLWSNFHPAVPIVFAYLFILAFASMLKTSWTDPGIIPRNLHPTNLNNANWNDEYGTAYDDMWPTNPPMPRESDPKSFVDALATAPLSFVVFVLCFLFMWSVGGLSAYHCWLVMRNVTTHEQLRDSVMSHHRPPNPFSFGNIAHNLWYVLCRPQPKSSLKRLSSYIARRKNYAPPFYPYPNNGHELAPAWNYP
ncbi:hypothetical protein NQZ79_g7917 [Umbelopsis isabellina]|nr:hypothetical protein NQZ79_g7917 [Umbelopsis isabellina]